MHTFIIIKYGIIFWGNSLYSEKIATLQKKVVRIMAGTQPRTSCRSLFKQSGTNYLALVVWKVA